MVQTAPGRAPLSPTIFVSGVKLAIAAGLLFSDFWSRGADPWLTPFLLVCVLAWDSTRVISVRNVVILYFALVLGLGPYVIATVDFDVVHRFAFVMGLLYLVGLGVGRLLERPAIPEAPAEQAMDERRRIVGPPERLLWIPILLQAVIVVTDVAASGPAAYLSGGAQVEGISDYGAHGLGALQIVKLGTDLLTVAMVAAYVASQHGRPRLHWRLLVVLLLVMPLLRLERGAFVINAVALLLLFQLHRAPGRRLAQNVGLLIILPVIMASVGLGLGVVRQAALTQGRGYDPSSVMQGEFSPVIVVDGALTRDLRFGGAALWGAMTTRFLPRQYFPDKIPNSTERFMRTYDIQSFAAGFSLAPTALGGLLLSQGWVGAAALAFGTGVLLGRRRVRVRGSPLGDGLAVLIYFTLYSLMRNDPVNSVTQLAVTVALFLLTCAAFRIRLRP